MSIFALIVFAVAAAIAIVENRRAWWIPALIILGVVLALVLTHGTQVTLGR